MAVEMDGAEPQSYEALFDLPGALISDSDYGAQYDVTADGQRFLLNVQRADVNPHCRSRLGLGARTPYASWLPPRACAKPSVRNAAASF